MHKLAATIAPYLESAIAGATGGYLSYKASGDTPWAGIAGGLAGAIAGPRFGRKLRAKAVEDVASTFAKAKKNQKLVHNTALADLHAIRGEYARKGLVENTPGVGYLKGTTDVYEGAVAPRLNTLVARPHQDEIMALSYEKALKTAKDTPFGLGGPLASTKLERTVTPLTRPHSRSGLKLEEDFLNLTNSQKKDIMRRLSAAGDHPDATEAVVNKILRQYRTFG